MKDALKDTQNRILPRLIDDLTVEAVENELMVFRNFGKDVICLGPEETKIYDLCKRQSDFESALQIVTKDSLFEAIGNLRKAKLFVPERLPKADDSRWFSTVIEQEKILFDSRRNKSILLDPTSRLIWDMCDGETTVSEAISQLSECFGLPLPAAEEILWAALSSLRSEQLIVSPLPTVLTRRDFVQKWAAAAAVFPILTSVLLPVPAAANSTECITNGNTGCQARFPLGRVTVCCPCTPGPNPPCPPFGAPGTGNSVVCTAGFIIDGNSCLDDSLAGFGVECNTISQSPRPGGNAQTNCAQARAAAISLGFGDYLCCECP